jgi:hypothetical protein
MLPKAKYVACVQKFDTFYTPQFPIKLSTRFKLVVKNNGSLRGIYICITLAVRIILMHKRFHLRIKRTSTST